MLNKYLCKRLLGSGLLVALMLTASGCWDRKEIENRGFVLGIGIDNVASPGPKGKYDLTQVTQEAGTRKLHVTFELPKLGKREGTKGGGAIEEKIVLAGEGESLYQISRAMNTKIFNSLFFEDIQIVVFSEAVAREGVAELLDFFVRNPDMRRRVKLFVTPGRAEDVLKTKLQTGGVNSLFIAKITRNVNIAPRFSSKADLGDIAEALARNRGFYMPLIFVEEGEVRLTQAAMFDRKGKMVDTMDEWKLIGAKIIRKSLKQGGFSAPHPCDASRQIVTEIQETHIETVSHLKDGELWFSVSANLIGFFVENTVPEKNVLDPGFEKAVEELLADQFTRQVRAAYRQSQEVRVDALNLGDLVCCKHPEYWKKVKDVWDEEVFPTVPMEVNIKVTIRRPGMTS